MGQYRPAGIAHNYPELLGRVSGNQVETLNKKARKLGLTNLDQRSSGIFRLLV
ncbi:hypothetical protein Dthio_PD2939 [Desulfonatronospira thiodismutans ASO3-1]|uniref:Uncharacterized protein n=1 Tax=Desulfonatronospira thiodismutans ASO3-1 TaxID=555779 RepID=D6SLF4_9BACT|nr:MULTISPECIES: hypothetical protein [Desulfonatronospira]EFI35515.1 hypothetical protein Dthio_PD2939 [Desulfonatronospira thiodismutans ASO3-1]